MSYYLSSQFEDNILLIFIFSWILLSTFQLSNMFINYMFSQHENKKTQNHFTTLHHFSSLADKKTYVIAYHHFHFDFFFY
jgi:hypothetical protein